MEFSGLCLTVWRHQKESRSKRPMSDKPAYPGQFGLTLSGGGFRATLFHLGVVRFLRKEGLLKRVRFISGVSGGAILAAHLGLNWDRYAGDDISQYAAAHTDVVRLAQKDIRNRILRRWIFGWITLIPRVVGNWSRVGLLQREYRLLYGSDELSSLPDVYQTNRPRTVLQCVSLTTGLPCTFGRSGFMRYTEEAEGRGMNLVPDDEITSATSLEVAFAVAASSAFPPMFPPIELSNKVLRSDEPMLDGTEYLTDGGVFDNLGLDRPLWWYEKSHQHKADQLDSFVVSDAEGSFKDQSDRPRRFRFTLPRNVRATHVLMKRISTLTWKYLRSLTSKTVLSISISRLGTSVPSEIHDAVKNIRTDLDHFTDLEVAVLIWCGEMAARAELEGKGWVASSGDTPNWPFEITPEALANQLKRSRRRKWIPLFLDLGDWYTWGLLIYLSALACVLRWVVFSLARAN